ncbi:MAG: FAD-dependent oxidoreductase [Actinobacteria bacterium]|nr:FAD-dependent oxidoreductase [Actinomycetota bacterium]
MPYQSPLDEIVQFGRRRFAGDYVLTAENLNTGSPADDEVAMGGYHIGIHRPSGRHGWRWDCGRPPPVSRVPPDSADRSNRQPLRPSWHRPPCPPAD